MTLEMPDVEQAVKQDAPPKPAERLVKGMTKRDYMRLYMQKRRAKLKEQASVGPAG